MSVSPRDFLFAKALFNSFIFFSISESNVGSISSPW